MYNFLIHEIRNELLSGYSWYSEFSLPAVVASTFSVGKFSMMTYTIGKVRWGKRDIVLQSDLLCFHHLRQAFSCSWKNTTFKSDWECFYFNLILYPHYKGLSVRAVMWHHRRQRCTEVAQTPVSSFAALTTATYYWSMTWLSGFLGDNKAPWVIVQDNNARGCLWQKIWSVP